ncbi:MAG: hypothetical protein V4489_03390 [Chlamydiota bacterium]
MSVISLSGQSVCQVARAVGSVFTDSNALILNAKVVEAFNSASDVFFSTKMPYSDSFKEALKTFKGANALATLPQQIGSIVKSVSWFIERQSFGALTGCIAVAAGTINKVYDAASFLDREVAVPFFKGVTELYKTVHFQAVAVGASVRFIVAAPRVADFCLSGELLKTLQEGRYDSSYIFQAVESVATMVFAGSILMGGGAQLTTAASAVGAFTKGVEFYWRGNYKKLL